MDRALPVVPALEHVAPLGSSEGGSAPLPKPPPDAVRAGGRRGAGAPPSEASNLRIAPAKLALEADHSCSRGHGNYLDRPLDGPARPARSVRPWLTAALDLLFPPFCPVCHAPL